MSNEAAERLRERLGLMSEGPESRRLSERMLDEALAAERRATVERIRAALHDEVGTDPLVAVIEVDRILDAEAER